MKIIAMTTAALLGLSVGAAHAQSWVEVEDESLMIEGLGMTVDQLEDADVYGTTGDQIAEIDDVLVDPATNQIAVELDVGGFLGMGEKNVAILLDQMTMADGRFTLDMTEEQLEALPDHED